MNTYDLIVIGAGSGGLVAATTGQRNGLKTAMIEKHKIGGECTHYGCVPSKAFINAAKAYHSLGKMDELGIEVNFPKADFRSIMSKVDNIVQGIYQDETPEVFEKMGIDVYVEKTGARFIDSHTVAVGGEKMKGRHFVICTGSSPRIPEIEGIENMNILHNENFWELRTFPEKIVFIGGGVISIELGQSLNRLGCEVTIIDLNDRVLKVTDPKIGNYLVEKLEKEGVRFITKARPIKFKDENTLIYEQDKKEKEISSKHFFVAAGRIPNVGAMQLENANIEYTKKGIQSNDFLQTSVPHIYACGDVTTPYKFTHTASHQANICIENILNGNTTKNDLSILPWAVFTEPQIGHVGLNEKEAREKYGDDHINTFEVEVKIDRFITDRKTGGWLKVIFDQKDLVVGAEAVGTHAGEWIQFFTLIIKNKIFLSKMTATIFAYPTYSEIVKKAFSRYSRTKK